jgi:2-polyprenyl-3-methyl-5-hydroxy-6-metoxy-1,4-benzoquinol methylase
MIQRCVVHESHAIPARTFAKRGVDIYVCPACGCIMADLQFVHEQYESAEYYTMAYQDVAHVEEEWGFRWRYILRAIAARIPKPRILDVGAGNGYFVHLARKEFGWQADGLEISDAQIAYARQAFAVDLLKAAPDDLTQRYDVVTSFNVLEHVADPMALLGAMNRRLRAGGCLLLTTPNPSCIHRRIRGLRGWAMVDPPHHINLFPRGALQEMLASASFEIRDYRTLSTYIYFVRTLDTRGQLLRRSMFHVLKSAHLGADHFFVCEKVAHETATPVPRQVRAARTSSRSSVMRTHFVTVSATANTSRLNTARSHELSVDTMAAR